MSFDWSDEQLRFRARFGGEESQDFVNEILRLRELLRTVVKNGPPCTDVEDSSCQKMTCCGRPEYRPHDPSCWWETIRKATEGMG